MPDTNILIDTQRRGSAIFTSEKLQQVWRETVEPELNPEDSVVVTGALTSTGMKAAVIFRRPVKILNLKGEWIVEGAFLHDWSGDSGSEMEAKVLFKL